ncbi:unnamed protein product [Durusdinium trenchii]|uniref:Uncharacterized protein n=1 Tax=Durusdinium trenchii TaxID=1381693 RepID=A0ABP0JJH6_9DINO
MPTKLSSYCRSPGARADVYCTPPARDLVLVMPMSYSNFDVETPKAVAQRKEEVNAFLERHAFPGVNSLRDTSDVFQHVRVKQLYPLDVAEELGDERMMSLLKMSGATERSQSSGSAGSALGGLRSFFSLRSAASTTSTMASVSEAPVPPRSCLAKKKVDNFDMATDEESVESVWV